MRDHRIKSNLFTKLDFENSHLASEFRCYYDRANDDYILSKSALFHLLQKHNPSQETSRQIASEFQANSYQSADLSMMVSLNEFGQSSQIPDIKLNIIKRDIHCSNSNSWFQVHQNGEIFLTNQMLLEALQQISKSRDDKFFSEHFSYITKDFDPSQPSQYSAQSLKDYMDWLAGLNQDKILQSNIDQLKNKCENGQAGEMVNLQDFLDKSNFESNLLRDINNYFMDNLFMTKRGILRNTSAPESPPPSQPATEFTPPFPPATALVPATALSTPPTPQNKTQNIINLLREFNGLKNPGSQIEEIKYDGIITFKTQNSIFALYENQQRVTQIPNFQTYNQAEPFRTTTKEWSYDEFIVQLNKQIAEAKAGQVSVPLQPTQPVHAPTTYSSSVAYPFQTYGPASPYGVQPWQPTLHQPAMPYGQTWQASQQKQRAVLQGCSLLTQQTTSVNYSDTLTFPTITGGYITYPISKVNYSPSVTQSALQCGVGGGASFGTDYQMSGRGYGVSYMALPQMSSPGTAVYDARNMGVVAIYVESLR